MDLHQRSSSSTRTVPSSPLSELSSHSSWDGFNEPPSSSLPAEEDHQIVITVTRIERILENIVDALKDNRVLTIPLRSRQSGNEVAISFPSTTIVGARRFTALLQVLSFIHDALSSGTIITKRNIYYQNPELFGSQDYVNRIVDDISFTFGCSRDDLRIVAASKGLIAGGSFDPGEENTGVPIPRAKTLEGLNFRSTRWILVIEKEATFRSLVATGYFATSNAGPGILVTAKGYPDLATRQFLHLVHSTHPQIPIHALVDFDPHGLAIMRTYKHGSRSLGHEENVTIEGLSWLGIKSSDVLPGPSRRLSSAPSSQLSQRSNGISSSQSSASQSSHLPRAPLGRVAERCLCSLTLDDRKKGVSILRALEDQHEQDAEQMTLAQELQLMLMLNVKAEIQAVDDAGDMTGWLDEQLSSELEWDMW